MTTPTPEAIEAAEAGMYQRMTWASLHWNALDPDQQRELAAAALTAAAPIIAAQAKAEALRELTDSYMGEWPFMRKKWGGNDDTEANAARDIAMKTMRWLQQQAETAEAASIEGKNE